MCKIRRRREKKIEKNVKEILSGIEIEIVKEEEEKRMLIVKQQLPDTGYQSLGQKDND